MNRIKFVSLMALLIFALILSGCAGNKPPTASIDSPKDKAELASKVVDFKGTGTDPEKKSVTYSWDFGDGTKDTTQNPKHTYAKAGSYTVTLTVTDDKKKTATAKITITVKNAAPTAKILANPTKGQEPLTVQFDGTGSTDPDDKIAKYEWDFGDGTAKSTDAKPKHTYEKAGTYTATLTVTDNEGATAKATVTITVEAPPPPPPPPTETPPTTPPAG
ncbi:MAG: PKD domain-containing protein [Candidatus Bipolaricaulia bacterium]